MGALEVLSGKVDVEDIDKSIFPGTPEGREEQLKNKSLWANLSVSEEKKLREVAVKARLIPEAYKDASFNPDMIKDNITNEMRSRSKNNRYIVKGYAAYSELCTGILSAVSCGEKLSNSYIIGAPNGFGKTSFANEAIIRMFSRGANVAPYVSLSELAEIKTANDTKLAKGLSVSIRGVNSDERNELDRFVPDGYQWDIERIYEISSEPIIFAKTPVDIIGRYSWSEYINSEVLFTYFTTLDSKVVESRMLQHLLYVRGTKGLPTIAMISTALTPYLNDPNLAEFVWDEIIDRSKSDKPCYDRVKHVSCYKDFRKLYMNSQDDDNYLQ